MRVVIFGGRGIDDRTVLDRAVAAAAEKGIIPTEVACGLAPGADELGRAWANERGVTVVPFPAAWGDLDAPGAVVRYRHDGSAYNAKAGFDRNKDMGEWADAGIGIWDGRSRGTKSMIDILKGLRKPVHVERVDEPPAPRSPGLFDEC